MDHGELIFLGTGVSTGLPRLPCLLHPSTPPCAVCHDAHREPLSRNRRGNVSLLLRPRGADGPCILIDCGKTFRESALRWFPEHRVRRVDALLLTHGHFDALGGLDELREVQDIAAVKNDRGQLVAFRAKGGPLPIYLTEATMRTCRGVYPYLMPRPEHRWAGEAGNDVPRRTADLEWNVFDEALDRFEVDGMVVFPFPVLHGGTYICMGFGLGVRARVLVLTDVKIVPERTMSKLLEVTKGKVDLLVVDTLCLSNRSNSHFGLDEALALVAQLRPNKTLLVGMSCGVGAHDETNEKLRQRSRDPKAEIFGLDVALAHDGLRVGVDLL